MICPEDHELEALRKLPPATKLAVMHGLIRQAFVLKMAWVRSTEPHLDEEEAWRKARELVSGGSP
jgi:hypothetical protein